MPTLHALAGIVHAQFIDPSLQLEVNMRQSAFIDLDPAYRADGAVQGTPLGKRKFHADGLQAFGTDRHDIQLR